MATVISMPTCPGFDPFSQAYVKDPQAWLQAVPGGVPPAFYYEPLDFWVLTRHADVRSAFTDSATFSSTAFRAIPVPPSLRSQITVEQERIANNIIDNILNMDPPAHTRTRKAAQQAITRQLVLAAHARIERTAIELIVRFKSLGHCDLMQDFGYQLTLSVIAGMLNLPPTSLADIRTWINDVFTLMTPINTRLNDEGTVHLPVPSDQLAAVFKRINQAHEFFMALIADRRAHPLTDDMTSLLVQATDDDGAPAFSPEKIVAHMVGLTAAGTDTTANLIGSAVRYLSNDPATRKRVLENPFLWDNVIEETLRRASVARLLLRVTTKDTEIAGLQIAAGSRVALNVAGANSDPSKFEDPLRFDIYRPTNNDHIAFGAGRHFCLGSPLARPEAKIALQVLYRELNDLCVDNSRPIAFSPLLTVGAMQTLPVQWTPSRGLAH
jgi:cytochrome P450